MNKFAIALLGALCCTLPVQAETVPSAADNAQIDAMLQPFLNGMTSARVKASIVALLGRSQMMQSKTAEVDYLGVQAEAAASAYGPIRACELSERRDHNQWSQTRLYICQHEKYLTRWLLVMLKTPTGWQPANLSFDDKFTLAIPD